MDCIKIVESLSIGESANGVADPLIKIEHGHLLGCVVEDLPMLQVHRADTYGVSVSHKSKALAVSPISNELTLKDHVTSLHVDLVELPQRIWPILDHVGDRVDRCA